MSTGQHPSDFVGYSVGVSEIPASVGYDGLLDFVGFPVGVITIITPTVGCKGLLDFSGYPVGMLAVTPIQPVPVVVQQDILLWGPSYLLYEEPDRYYLRQRREEEEIIIL